MTVSSDEYGREVPETGAPALKRAVAAVVNFVNAGDMVAAAAARDRLAAMLDADRNLMRVIDTDVDDDGRKILAAAAAAGDIETVMLLLDRHADANVPYNAPAANAQNESLLTGILTATDPACVPMARLLLRFKANPNHANAEGMTPVMLAAALNVPDLVRDLARAGADLNAQDNFGNTALMHAVHARFSAMDALLACGANVNVVNMHDPARPHTVLNAAWHTTRGGSPSRRLATLARLIEKGAKMDPQGRLLEEVEKAAAAGDGDAAFHREAAALLKNVARAEIPRPAPPAQKQPQARRKSAFLKSGEETEGESGKGAA